MYTFNFKGGTVVDGNGTYKFLVIGIQDNEEFMAYDALRKGIFVKDRTVVSLDQEGCQLPEYTSNTPYVKIFTSQQGFGIQKKYYNFFFMLSGDNKMVTIKPFGFERAHKDHYFQAKGRLLKSEEIEPLVCKDTFNFYQRQTYVSVDELRRMVTTQTLTEGGQLLPEVRKLRF